MKVKAANNKYKFLSHIKKRRNDHALDNCVNITCALVIRDGKFLYDGRLHTHFDSAGSCSGAYKINPGQKPCCIGELNYET